MPDLAPLQFIDRPTLTGSATMLLAFSGWMDGGDVSTGTVERLVERLDADPFAEIDWEGFYIQNMPGSMEVTAMFRPHVTIEDGLLKDIDLPDNTFYVHTDRNLVLFVGEEPNVNWRSFGECVFEVARVTGVKRIMFVGSFAGSVPHTREPRLYATASDRSVLRMLRHYGVRPSTYSGPGSFINYLMSRANERHLDMVSLTAEIPAYIQGTNPLSIEAVTRRLGAILDLPTDIAELRTASDEWEGRVTDAVEKDEELAEKIRELEESYDDELIKFESEVDTGEAPA